MTVNELLQRLIQLQEAGQGEFMVWCADKIGPDYVSQVIVYPATKEVTLA